MAALIGGVEIPRRLRQRTKDARGYPVPFVVAVVDGKPDFRLPAPERWQKCVADRRCGLCGEPIVDAPWFVGGPSCAKHRIFLDPAMHLDCAEYALRVCPFLAAPHGHFSDLDRRPPPPGFGVVAGVNPARPDVFMLGRTSGWRLKPFADSVGIVAEAWLEIRWWRHGSEIK